MTMHSSFPRSEERRGYRHVAAKESVRHWIVRVIRMIRNSPRLIVAVLLSLFLLMFLFWGGLSRSRFDGNHVPVLLVTVLDGTSIEEQGPIIEKVLENREEYANAHRMSSL